MARSLFVCVAIAAASAGCGTNVGISERPPANPIAALSMPATSEAASLVPEIPGDRRIRRDLDTAIARDTALQKREISFIVTHGDVSVIGTVRTEKERRKINGLAFDIGGVKSVANALRVTE